MDTIKFLNACALVEDRLAEIYHSMEAASRRQSRLELADIWKEMASDEEDHAHQIRLARRLSRQEVFANIDPEDAGVPFALLERAGLLLDRLRSGSITEREMLRVAVELEERFQEIHTAYTLAFHDPSMKRMFDALARADKEHVARLTHRLGKAAGESLTV